MFLVFSTTLTNLGLRCWRKENFVVLSAAGSLVKKKTKVVWKMRFPRPENQAACKLQRRALSKHHRSSLVTQRANIQYTISKICPQHFFGG